MEPTLITAKVQFSHGCAGIRFYAMEDNRMPQEHPADRFYREKQDDPRSGQVGGDHYKRHGEYQPWCVLPKWLSPEELLGYAKGEAIVYLMRNKCGREDIEKARHVLELYLDATK
jgi:hypothetical protein